MPLWSSGHMWNVAAETNKRTFVLRLAILVWAKPVFGSEQFQLSTWEKRRFPEAVLLYRREDAFARPNMPVENWTENHIRQDRVPVPGQP